MAGAEVSETALKQQLDPAVVRGGILDLEAELRQHPNQLDIPPTHHFAEGLYCREIFVPKGTMGTSKIHLQEHICIIAKGEVSVLTEDGAKRIVGPSVFVTKPGTKRLVYVHEDTTWITVHACTETDPAKVEELLVVDTYEQFTALAEQKEAAWRSLP